MNREILFSGMTPDGKWVEGDRYAYLNNVYIIPRAERLNPDEIFDSVEVIPDTVGQYTGLKDKNGKKIFEGDKLLSFARDAPDEVVFRDGAFGYIADKWGFIAFSNNPNFLWYDNASDEIEVIGNIHEQENKDE